MSHDDGPRRIAAAQLTLGADGLWGRLPLIGVGLGVVGSIAAWSLGRGETQQFAFSWLVAFLYFLSIALGGLFFVLVHFATKAGWGIVVRRLAENLMAALPGLALLGIPVLLSVHELYHWSHADAVAQDHLLQGKQGYLNTGFFYIRAAVYFVVWSVLAIWYARTSRRQDSSGDERLSRRMTAVSGPAIALFAVTVTFAAFDWIMSLDPHWYSTIFGVYYFAGCLVGAFATMILMMTGLERSGHLDGVVTSEHYQDVGKLLFAFTVFWAYIGFSQYLLIWYGNIPEETAWFLHRMEGGWRNVTIALALGHFIVPFFFLMSRHIKRRRPLLVLGALWMLLMHLVDIYWLVMPTLHHHDVHLGPVDLAALIGVGGWFLAIVGWMLRSGPLIPLRDPRLNESLSFENV